VTRLLGEHGSQRRPGQTELDAGGHGLVGGLALVFEVLGKIAMQVAEYAQKVRGRELLAKRATFLACRRGAGRRELVGSPGVAGRRGGQEARSRSGALWRRSSRIILAARQPTSMLGAWRPETGGDGPVIAEISESAGDRDELVGVEARLIEEGHELVKHSIWPQVQPSAVSGFAGQRGCVELRHAPHRTHLPALRA
jgi:hypothetical protein